MSNQKKQALSQNQKIVPLFLIQEHDPKYEIALKNFAKKLGYPKNQYGKLKEALTHKSFSNECQLTYDNQRLEYLGDAVVDLICAEELFKWMPQFQEGDLTNARASLVNEYCMSRMAELMGIDLVLRVGKGEHKQGEQAQSVRLADAFESVVGASYLDLGKDQTHRWLWRILKVPLYVMVKQSHLSFESLKQIYLWSETELDSALNDLTSQNKVTKSTFQPLKTQLHEKLHTLYHQNPTFISEKLDQKKFQYTVKIADRILAQATGSTPSTAEWECVKLAWRKIDRL